MRICLHSVFYFEDVGACGDEDPGEAAPHGPVLVLGVLRVQGGRPQVK